MRKDRTKLRTSVIKTKLSGEEKDHLDRLCEESGLSRSGFIRQAVFTGKIIPARVTGTADEKLLEVIGYLVSEYGRIGNNLNQIAKHLNSGGTFNTDSADLIRRIASDLETLKHELLKHLGKIYGNDKAPRL